MNFLNPSEFCVEMMGSPHWILEKLLSHTFVSTFDVFSSSFTSPVRGPGTVSKRAWRYLKSQAGIQHSLKIYKKTHRPTMRPYVFLNHDMFLTNIGVHNHTACHDVAMDIPGSCSGTSCSICAFLAAPGGALFWWFLHGWSYDVCEIYSLLALKVVTCVFQELILLIILSFGQLCPVRAFIESSCVSMLQGRSWSRQHLFHQLLVCLHYFSAVPQYNVARSHVLQTASTTSIILSWFSM